MLFINLIIVVLGLRSTRFFSLQRPGEPGECLLGGDYDRGDGTGGFPLLQGLGPSSVYRAPVKEGLVAGSNGQHSALFGIFLKLVTPNLT